MSVSICEPADEPGSLAQAEDDLVTLRGTYSTEQFYLDECDVGLGVFANRDIAPGEVILAIEGPPIDFAETKRRGPRECMAIQVGYNNYIDTQPPGVFVNHSCAPNCGIKQNRFLVALRPIRKGEEIRYDYSTTMEEQSFTMKCLCGAPNCRGVVRDFSTLPRPVRENYIAQGMVMSFILRRNLYASHPRPPRVPQSARIHRAHNQPANEPARTGRPRNAPGPGAQHHPQVRAGAL